MYRFFAFLAAIALTTVTVSSSCLASSAENIRFQLQPAGTAGEVQLSLFSGTDGHRNTMGSTFRTSELAGGWTATNGRGEGEFALAGLPSHPYNERRQESA